MAPLKALAMDNVPVFLFILIVFANRYVFGLYLKLVKGRRFDETVADYEPTVTIVVPLFNEGQSIYDTVLSLLEQDYPRDKLAVIVGCRACRRSSTSSARRCSRTSSAPCTRSCACRAA